MCIPEIRQKVLKYKVHLQSVLTQFIFHENLSEYVFVTNSKSQLSF